MRDIKFRIWSKSLCHIYYHEDNFNEPNLWNLKLYVQGGMLVNGVDSELMQYTGLKDKNGKEIYEGDILQYKHYYACKRWWSHTEDIPIIDKEVEEQRQNYSIEKIKIIFVDGGFGAYPISGADIKRGERFNRGAGTSADYEERYWDFEVIGNIYENPELLERLDK